MKSAVAGVVDRGGGLRVVVGPRAGMKYHRGDGEYLYILPGLRVIEPVPIEEAAELIERVTQYVRQRHKAGKLRF